MFLRSRLKSSKVSLLLGAAAFAMSAAFAGVGAMAESHGKGSGQKMAGQGGQGGGQGQGQVRKGRSLSEIFRDVTGDDDDSDRPDWAGQAGGKDGAGGGQPDTSGSKKGDLFGDLWIILRDDNGVPILTAEGFVQPLDSEGNLIPLDEEGHPLDETLTEEVELGRLNVGRAPTSVLTKRADEVITLLNDATEITLDAAGRIVVTTPDGDGGFVTKTIDSPLENLAIYVALMTDGYIPGVDDLPGDDFDFMVADDDDTTAEYTIEDLEASAAFLAAATDKTGVFTADEIAYINAFLDVNTEAEGNVVYSVIDYSGLTYDREATYSDVTATVLIEQPDGSFVPTEINIWVDVFGSEAASASGTLSAYTLMADDSRTVIEYIHEFAIPEPL